RPEDRGFQETLWCRGGGLAQPSDAPQMEWKTAYFDPILNKNGKEVKTAGYCTDVFTDATVKFIGADSKKPFFAFVAFNAPHGPLGPSAPSRRTGGDLSKARSPGKSVPEDGAAVAGEARRRKHRPPLWHGREHRHELRPHDEGTRRREGRPQHDRDLPDGQRP